MEPLIIKPIYKEKIWGSRELLQEYYSVIHKEQTGEVWNFVVNSTDVSTFQDSNLEIRQILSDESICEKYFGSKISKNKQFPFLIKTLFINEKISLQVHPDNKFAQKYENSSGKDEVWYVLSADDNSYAYIGFKENIKKEKIRELLKENKVMDYLKKVKIKAGDIISIPAGTIHSISGKTILYEVHQNSSITYRLYDWYDRKLDIDKALKILKCKDAIIKNKDNGRLIKTKNFTLNKVNILGKKEIRSPAGMEVITIVKGEGTLVAKKSIKLYKGMTVFIPSDLKKYTILGDIEMLVTY